VEKIYKGKTAAYLADKEEDWELDVRAEDMVENKISKVSPADLSV
jgi:hypothetical protein